MPYQNEKGEDRMKTETRNRNRSPFEGCRNIPRHESERFLGEGERCLRDRDKRIRAWAVGYSREEWELLKRWNPDWHESVGYYNVKKGRIV